MSAPEQGDVFTIPDTAKNERRVVVVSEELFNRGESLVVVPFTSKRFQYRSGLSSCVVFERSDGPFTKPCVAQCEQVSRITKDKLTSLSSLGRIKPEKTRELVKALGVVIGADCEPAAT